MSSVFRPARARLAANWLETVVFPSCSPALVTRNTFDEPALALRTNVARMLLIDSATRPCVTCRDRGRSPRRRKFGKSPITRIPKPSINS